MPKASLMRIVNFTATHHYGRADRSRAWNEARFGDQVHPHEHEYQLEVTVEGEPDPETSFVVDLPELDAVLAVLVGPLDGGNLNETIPEVREGDIQPSTEALARWFWERIGPRVPGEARLRRIRLWESGALAGQVDG